MPAIGDELTINYANETAADLQFVVLGVGTIAPLSLDTILSGSGATCSLQITADVLEWTTSWSIAVPNDPLLVGAVIHAQGIQTELSGLDIAGANTKYAEITLGQL